MKLALKRVFALVLTLTMLFTGILSASAKKVSQSDINNMNSQIASTQAEINRLNGNRNEIRDKQKEIAEQLKQLEKETAKVEDLKLLLDMQIEYLTEEIITTQTRLALEGLTNADVVKTIIAYEPIWAIGTGKTATKEDANETIKWVREEVEKIYGKDVADSVVIQYGGSVKSSNAKELFEMSDIDGGLVGGASLEPEEFAKIANYNK